MEPNLSSYASVCHQSLKIEGGQLNNEPTKRTHVKCVQFLFLFFLVLFSFVN
ncbi:MAG: hypothetical protein AVDCRST_MAG96-3233, partial [uncultured Segetibacter sp.]